MCATACTSMVLTSLIVVNGHGGNVQSLIVALEEVHFDTGALTALVKAWQLSNLPAPDGAPAFEGHAGRQETEIMLAISPEDVDREAFVFSAPTVELGEMGSVAPAQYTPMESPVNFLVTTWESTEHGHYGDPSMATAERGQLVLDTWAANLTKLLRDVKSGEIKITTRTAKCHLISNLT